MLGTLAELEEEAEIAGIDFLVSDIPAAEPSRDRRGAMERRSLSSFKLIAVPTNGRSSGSSSESGSGGGGEATSRMVLGRSRRERPEYRLGTPTVDAGEGGKNSIISTSSSSASTVSGSTGAGGLSMLIEFRRDLERRC